MRVPRDQQVQTVVLVEFLVPLCLVAAVEVCDSDLPVGGGLGKLLLHPLLLLVPGLPQKSVALLHGSRAAAARAVRAGRVVLPAANIVVGVVIGVLGIHGIRVEHEDVDAEALVWELNPLHVVLGGQNPAVALPGVGDLLVPSVVELAATVVVVPQNAQPGRAIQAGAGIHAHKHIVKHLLRKARHPMHRTTAIFWNSAPIEIVPDVQH
mmetsp:Transcript_23907/g.71412  ORF Transcript_23907/g.71412 Transcript_23907/m.71412 type:complete len:209 (+) Transcript_23907:282-908(+)